MLAIGAMILTPLADVFAPGIPALTYAAMAYILLWVAAALTVYTGYVYFRNGLRRLAAGRNARALSRNGRHTADFIGIGVHQRLGDRRPA